MDGLGKAQKMGNTTDKKLSAFTLQFDFAIFNPGSLKTPADFQFRNIFNQSFGI